MRWASLRRLVLAFSSVSAVAVLAPAAAQAQVLRFSTTAAGKIISTGNTLGLSKALNENGPGTKDSIGTFIALGNSVDDIPFNPLNSWPVGTTYDWTKNGSTAVLALPAEGTVLYAELIWGGSDKYSEDVTALLGTPVTLTAGNASITVPPDAATALTIAQTAMAGFAVNYYMRSADVTGFVKAAGGAVYSVSGVPATQTTTINSLNAAGWTLTVVVRDSAEPVRNLSVFVGGSFVDENSQQDYSINGFCTPPAGVVNGKVSVSTIEGDASLTGDQLLIAPTGNGPFVQLSGVPLHVHPRSEAHAGSRQSMRPLQSSSTPLLQTSAVPGQASTPESSPESKPESRPPSRTPPSRPPPSAAHHGSFRHEKS